LVVLELEAVIAGGGDGSSWNAGDCWLVWWGSRSISGSWGLLILQSRQFPPGTRLASRLLVSLLAALIWGWPRCSVDQSLVQRRSTLTHVVSRRVVRLVLRLVIDLQW